jgi:hypothetical protein
MKIVTMVCILSLLIGGTVLSPMATDAAPWISGSESYAAPWLRDVERELQKKEYAALYANDPRVPQQEALRLLNQAARAQQENDPALAQQLAHEAMDLFEEGVRRHYYSATEIESLLNAIRKTIQTNLG